MKINYTAICDASFCVRRKFAYMGYRVFRNPICKSSEIQTNHLAHSSIWLEDVESSTKAETLALSKLITTLTQYNILSFTKIYCDYLPVVNSVKKTGININHIKGHKPVEDRKNWIDNEFFKLDRDLRKLLRIRRLTS